MASSGSHSSLAGARQVRSSPLSRGVLLTAFTILGEILADFFTLEEIKERLEQDASPPTEEGWVTVESSQATKSSQ